MKRILYYLLFSAIAMTTYSQTDNPSYYAEIPDYPDSFSAGTITSRLLDGLGFRYYWATEGLRSEDLAYRPSEEARTAEETLDHVLGLSQVIVNTSRKKVHKGIDSEGMSFEEKRNLTLKNVAEASMVFREASDEEMKGFEMIFKRQNGELAYPLWNLINGPIADALWHVGQVVTFRRASGNPFDSKVSVLQGKRRE